MEDSCTGMEDLTTVSEAGFVAHSKLIYGHLALIGRAPDQAAALDPPMGG